MVVPAAKIRSREGNIVVKGSGEATLTEDGVTTGDGTYRPTVVADEGIATKLGIPLAYVRRLRSERSDIYDANVTPGWPVAHSCAAGSASRRPSRTSVRSCCAAQGR
jgi:hypothetical protein